MLTYLSKKKLHNPIVVLPNDSICVSYTDPRKVLHKLEEIKITKALEISDLHIFEAQNELDMENCIGVLLGIV